MLAAMIAAVVSAPLLAQDSGRNPIEALEAPTVEIIGTTPLPTLGIPKDRVPNNVQGATAGQIEQQRPLSVADFLNQNIGNLSINEIGTNPFQPDVNFRGFTASPLLGTPQGLSVFQDGVRINEPFGDIVNWDLIPEGAISSMNLIPGSNPLYGLNTLGGALAIRTKSGRQFPGFGAEAHAGSFGRKGAEVQFGGQSGAADYFISGNMVKEDGWRDFSPSEVRQFFAKAGHETASTDFDLSITHADNDLIGNELVPLSFFDRDRESVFTRPDQTLNKMTMVNLTASHYVNDALQIAGNVYYRRSDRTGLNGDSNDDFENSANDGATGANGGLGFNDDTGANNHTRTEQRGTGLAFQVSKISEGNQFTVGTSFDSSRSDFSQSTQEGIFDSTRAVTSSEPIVLENQLEGNTDTWSLFATDTFALSDATHLTVAARYNNTHVKTTDQLNPVPPNLDGDFTYKKFNPAAGITHRMLNDNMTVYANWGQGNRAPSPIELGCADPANPCTLPNALASDPFLQQVVARTWEAGLRGRAADGINWNLSAFRSVNKDDIIFVSTSAAAGFFTNFGETMRQGIEAGFSAALGRATIDLSYGYTKATFESTACLLVENNSTRGTATQCASDDEILVSTGDTIPGVPEHSVKVGVSFPIAENWSAGVTGLYFSRQYARGNENNQHQAGTFTDRFGGTRTFLG
ncbi:MAG: TonB-dependent receptor, partial [Burkholderiales bacterium]